MSGPTGRRPVLQVHPTRRCNLACAHCYTSSGPDQRAEVDLRVLAGAVADAAALGYRQLAVSGGEPFLYGPLAELLRAGRDAGMSTTVTTNGMLLSARRWEPVAPYLDLLAVSVDGPPAEHNLMRRDPSAFERMLRHLPAVRAAGVPLGLIFTLTRWNADQLEWLVGFAAEQGATLVQVHPLTQLGRARTDLPAAGPDAVELLAARVELDRLARLHPGLELRLDAATTGEIGAHRTDLVAAPDAPLAELVPVLVVDDLGAVTPLTHDLDPSFGFGSLRYARLAELAAAWQVTTAGRLSELLAATHEHLTRPDADPIAYWYDTVAELSRRVLVR
jgi:MoaA/NifB/PqqE/SkfB family radical SAM enzyme